MNLLIIIPLILAAVLITVVACRKWFRKWPFFLIKEKMEEAAAELERSLSLLKATIESTADGILVVDHNRNVVLHNQKFLDMWHIPDKLIKTGLDDVLIKFTLDQLKYPEVFVEIIEKLYSEPQGRSYDTLEFKDGRFYERFSQPQVINGRSVGRVWSFRDITENKKAEAQIIAARDKAEESDRLKTAFLHNVSHEIRTPMNAIIGFSILLNEEGQTDKDRHQYTDFIFQSAKQLLSIINDIVDISNIEIGQAKAILKPTNVNSILRNLNEQFRIKDNPSELQIDLKLSLEDERANILTDDTKLIQILSNLISNAIKFTASGKVDFGYVQKGEFLEFYVNDTGIGIPFEHQSKIFDRFYQVDSAKSRQYGGTGIGLSICKAYVGLLGGDIWLRSTPGKGSSFSFTIPYKQALP